MRTVRSKAYAAALLGFVSFAAIATAERSSAQSASGAAPAAPAQQSAGGFTPEARAASIKALAATADALAALAKTLTPPAPAQPVASAAQAAAPAAGVQPAASAQAADRAAAAVAAVAAAVAANGEKIPAKAVPHVAAAVDAAAAAIAANAPHAAAAASASVAPPAQRAATPAPAQVLSPAPQAASVPAVPAAPHWSYVPVSAPAIPAVQQKDWVRRPLDAFILAKLESKGLKPAPEADRATFIRRATLDVWGLLPTPEEVSAFVSDSSPDAYEKLADRLLASPNYGERQTRRWLDLARYSDSAGFQGDATRNNTYRYRDYVINAFNSDKPFDRFIREQIAGDEIAPDSQEALVATGFLTQYPDNPNSRDMIQRKYQITTDMTDTVGSVFLGSTVGCARCHNHKTDKITMKDYYSLQSFFANTSTTEDFQAAKGFAETAFEKDVADYEAKIKAITDEKHPLIEKYRDKAFIYHKERYLTDTREAIFKDEKDWTPVDRWVNHRLHNKNVTNDDLIVGAYLRYLADDKEAPGYGPESKADLEHWLKITQKLQQFNKEKPEKGSDTITRVEELGHSDAPKSFIFFGGNHERPLDEVKPAFPEAISTQDPGIVPTATSSGRRAALANWLASPDNPLTARVFVNRVWSNYFVKGIVATTYDFGKAGDRPSNQELLDYLASDFTSHGWSIKHLHREILLSAAYRQSSDERPEVAKVDPDNRLYAVFPRQRLEAEVIRDIWLQASGKLVEKVGGPSVLPPLPKNVNYGQLWQVAKDKEDWYRRSVYIFTRRSNAYPLLEVFNTPNTQLSHAAREVTTTPLQALALLNNDQVEEYAQGLAGRILKEAGDDSGRIDRLYQVLFSRSPDEFEKNALLAYLDNHAKVLEEKADNNGRLLVATPIGFKLSESKIDPLRAAAFVDLVHVVGNSNDFIYRF